MTHQGRLVGVAAALHLCFCLLILQFYRIQILQGEKWTKIARSQHQFSVVLPAKRGQFYSSGEPPQPLVIEVPKFHLYADLRAIPQESKAEICDQVSRLFALNGESKQKLLMECNRDSRSRKLVKWVDAERMERLLTWWRPFSRSKRIAGNALYFVQDYQRCHPFGKFLGQVLHTVREERDPTTHRAVPTGGLELVFDRYVQGVDGKHLLLRSPRHPMEVGKTTCLPQDGADVYLTISHYLQAVAEEQIAKAVQSANAKGGWAVMMEPRTGEILALAQVPSFDPTFYREYFNASDQKEDTKVKAITDPYEPGSTMKPLTLAICLQANEEMKRRGKAPLFHPHERMATRDGRFPGRTRPLRDSRPHAYMNMYMALQKSSNIYMARLVQRIIASLGEAWYRDKMHQLFRFGERLGIELPSESPGLLPEPGKKHASGRLEWSVPTPYSLAIGHNVLATSLQMLRCYAILANGGYDVQPTLVRKIVKTTPRGERVVLIDNTRPERVQSFARLLDAPIVQEVVRAMKYVTKPGGSAPRADIPQFTEAGKTSTSEKIVGGVYSQKHHISTFIGFAPVVNPKFVLLIAIDEPEAKFIPGEGKNQYGGKCAAPAFREIGLQALQYFGIEPDDPLRSDWKSEVEQLQRLYKEWNVHEAA